MFENGVNKISEVTKDTDSIDMGTSKQVLTVGGAAGGSWDRGLGTGDKSKGKEQRDHEMLSPTHYKSERTALQCQFGLEPEHILGKDSFHVWSL